MKGLLQSLINNSGKDGKTEREREKKKVKIKRVTTVATSNRRRRPDECLLFLTHTHRHTPPGVPLETVITFPVDTPGASAHIF